MKDWGWLKDANAATGLKGWSIPPLWWGTFAVFASCTIWVVAHPKEGLSADQRLPVGWMGLWTGILVLYSAVQRGEQKDHRDTDYEALRIKAGATQPTNVTVQSQQAQVNATPEGAK